jgi:hypothetical protein
MKYIDIRRVGLDEFNSAESQLGAFRGSSGEFLSSLHPSPSFLHTAPTNFYLLTHRVLYVVSILTTKYNDFILEY